MLRGCRVERVTFNEITAEAVRAALAVPRQVRRVPTWGQQGKKYEHETAPEETGPDHSRRCHTQSHLCSRGQRFQSVPLATEPRCPSRLMNSVTLSRSAALPVFLGQDELFRGRHALVHPGQFFDTVADIHAITILIFKGQETRQITQELSDGPA